ncbi:IS3 family transposase [Zooshikella sp. WH53]|uniref:IS3 family transposase n=1 Tax=Zooshikella harenae TaxID=2827238 RepID=A0ABS5ZBS2_9GAMM|nr:IS3 family transposase [Zooshikella harenae]
MDNDIIELFEHHKGRYGSPRITKALKDNKQCVNHKRVAKRMVALGLQAKQAKKFKATTNSEHGLPVAENFLQQDFSAKKPNEKWVGDITYVWTLQGWLYLAIFIDVFSRQVIGWLMSRRINKELVYDALLMALWRRNFTTGVIVHSDRGSQYCSKKYQQLLKDNKLICSMSGKGCSYDNALAESFFHSLKVECIYDYTFSDRAQAKKIIFEYIEVYYNQQRSHSSIGYKTPARFEQLCV